jgi:hypothetical protein
LDRIGRRQQKKRMGATNVGVRRAHPYLWSLSSPQQPLETEDSPTVSSCPTIYIARRVPRKRVCPKKMEPFDFLSFSGRSGSSAKILSGLMSQDNVIVSRSRRKTSTPGPDLRLPNSFELRWPTLLHVFQFHLGYRPQSSPARVTRYRNSAGAVCRVNRDNSRYRGQLFELRQLQ